MPTKEKQRRAPEPPNVVAPPCQEGGLPEGSEPQEPLDGLPPVRSTKTLQVYVTRRHNLDKATWLEFCAAVTALAEQIPPGVNPSVNVRSITVSWEERS